MEQLLPSYVIIKGLMSEKSDMLKKLKQGGTVKKLSGFVFLLIVFLLLRSACIAHEIHRAVIKGNLSVVKCLLQKDPQAVNLRTVKGLSALHLASEMGYSDIVKLLVKKGAPVNVRDFHAMSPLHWASLYGRTEVIEYLLANKADIKSLDKCGRRERS
ncbi:MAG: ankyrin repeat domain-containing protein [Candidatus Xenobiia bacterium LiM19]